ncbi:MAG TPA: hypothetical protein VFK85_03345, partial [Anaeromyxobacteraceae bacterium]|nr:hypothetical protein [Anaeromyxobacteraceae bacterium]
MQRARSSARPLVLAFIVMVAAVASCGFFDVADLQDEARVVVSPREGLTTSELGGTAAFTVALAEAPDAEVRIPVSSSNTAEGTATPTSLTFGPDDWQQPQTVT